MKSFKLSDAFLEKYKTAPVGWGPLGEFVYLRTYSRVIESEDRNEVWWETVKRVVEGTFQIQKEYVKSIKLPWSDVKAQKSAQCMYDKIFNFKFLPPGRGLWIMGTPFVKDKGSAALNNCGFVSTEDIDTQGSFPFAWAMDALMLGVGIGFDTKGAGKTKVKSPKQSSQDDTYKIPDSREGWVESLRALLDAFFLGTPLPKFDYSAIREAGRPIKGFGGTSSGPEPLKTMHERIASLLAKNVGQKVASTVIVDIMNMIGCCVVAGNVRRSAEIAIGDWKDEGFTTMKDYNLYPEELQSHRWASNNSIFAKVGETDYHKIARSIVVNGEPGIVWLDNIRNYGRMKDGFNDVDRKVMGVNPCIVGSSMVQTDVGLRKAKDLVGKKFVAIVDGVAHESTDQGFWSSGVKPVFKVTLRNGLETTTTADHKLMTKRGWVEVKDMTPKDELVIGDNRGFKYEGGVGTWIEGFILGWLIGDGTFKTNAQDIEVPVLLMWVEEKYENVMDYPPAKIIYDYVRTFKHRSDFTGWTLTRTKNVYKEYRMKSHVINDIANRYDVFRNEKAVYKEGSYEFNRGLLQGFFDTDGTVMKWRKAASPGVRLPQSDMDRLLAVQRLLLTFGILSNIYKNRRPAGKRLLPDGHGGNKLYDCKADHELEIAAKSFELFMNVIGFVDPEKQTTALHEMNTCTRKYMSMKFFSPIKTIEEIGEEEVFDCTIPGPHRFTANGVITSNCSEQSLESKELCCLVETFPSRHETFDEYKKTLKYAYLYAKTVTLLPTHWEDTNAVLMKNRRIGTSQSGIIDAFQRHGRYNMMQWSDNGYEYLRELDKIYSNWLCIPRSIKITSVKPSGTVSLLCGVSPGIHYPHAEYYIRRVRVDTNSPLVPVMRAAGYPIEFSAYGKTQEEREGTSVISFPVHEPMFYKKKDEVSAWEQVKNCVDYQRVWADNNVSITVTFKKEEAKDIPVILEAFESELKSISFLPLSDHGYDQAPYEECDKDTYEAMAAKITKPDFSVISRGQAPKGSVFCDGDKCELV